MLFDEEAMIHGSWPAGQEVVLLNHPLNHHVLEGLSVKLRPSALVPRCQSWTHNLIKEADEF
jgi:hypothetical protein